MEFVGKPNKLNPPRLLTLAETRSRYAKRGVVTVLAAPAGQCWAEVRIAEARDPGFRACENKCRQGFLNFLVHYNRELAARELMCEIQNVEMSSIAYESEEEMEKHQTQQRAALKAYLDSRDKQ